ncbi:MAG: DUF370 domain-containing protein [Oscillospiraceae bacterium]|nr:DUF370 domain-containing protein [Oscillospiraceae bacterium]
MDVLHIGHGNVVNSARIIAIVSPDSAPVKRTVKDARDRGMLIDASCGRPTRSVIIMDSDHVVLSSDEPRAMLDNAGDKGDTDNG